MTFAFDYHGNTTKVLEMKGNGQIATIGNSDLGTVGRDVTVAFWFKSTADNATSDYLIGGKYLPRLVLNDGSSPRLDINSGSANAYLYGSTNVDDGQWHYLAFTVDGEDVGGVTVSEIKLYIDGQLAASQPLTGTTANGVYFDSVFALGARNNNGAIGNETRGYFDDVRIYNETLTLPQLNAISGIPEPMTVSLLAAGGLFLRRRK